MGEDRRWHAKKAWLGGDELATDVLIAASDGVFTSVTPESPPGDADLLHGVVIPGLVSAHSHAFHRALRGRTHDLGGDFWAWRRAMYETAGRLAPGSYRRLAEAVFAEMLRSGITCVGEFHYLHHRPDGSPYDDKNALGAALLEAAASVGIRITLLDTAYLSSTVEGDPPLAEQRRFSDGSFDAWADRVVDLMERETEGLTRVGVAAHSVRGVPRRYLKPVAMFAEDHDLPLHIHASEQPSENAECIRAHGLTPVALLDSEGFLGPRTTVVHGTHVTKSDIEMLASSGATVCFCPTTEAELGDGIGPAVEYADAGVPLSLGSDSNTVIDVLEEAHRLESHDRLRLGKRGIHSPTALLRAATEAGARALGWQTGRIQPGFAADMIELDPQSSDLAGTPSDLASIAHHATRASVRNVVVGGNPTQLAEPTYPEIE